MLKNDSVIDILDEDSIEKKKKKFTQTDGDSYCYHEAEESGSSNDRNQ